MNSDVLTSGSPSTGGQVRRYMMVNPDLYKDLTTRLKFSTPPEVKNLISTDAEIEAILKDPKLPIHEKRDMLSDAMHRLQVFKQMIDQDSAAASEPATLFPGVTGFQPYTPRPHASRLFTSTPRSSSQQQQTRRRFAPQQVGVDGDYDDDSERTTMPSAAIPTQSAALPFSFQGEQSGDRTSTQVFGTPEEGKPSTSTSKSRSRDLHQEIVSEIPQSYKREALQTLKAMEAIPGFNIDPTSLQASMRGTNIGDIAEIFTTFAASKMKTSAVNREAQQMVALLAQETKLPASVIHNPTYQHFFQKYRTRKSVGSQRKGLPGDPTQFIDWQDVTSLPGRITRSHRKY